MSRAHLISRFAKAGLPLELAPSPLVRGAGTEDIVQLGIARPDRASRLERFRLWAGADSNRIEVEGVDKHLRQLVLLVSEPRRAFAVAHRKGAPLPPGAVVVGETQRSLWLRHWTIARKRHFLAGMDEAHLFLAQLPRPVSTVWAAHVALKGEDVCAAERGACEPALRQGEWFFISLLPRELAEVEAAAKKSLAPVRRDAGIAQAAGLFRAGRPHVADEVLVLQHPLGAGRVQRVYVRGAVRHPDHATVTLRPWRRALGSAEAVGQPTGVTWVD